ncbi:hypothetical protein [Nocardioides convexus]|nr:hypothetical protein [Nocardioides convexus]
MTGQVHQTRGPGLGHQGAQPRRRARQPGRPHRRRARGACAGSAG